MIHQTILFQTQGCIARLTLNRPERLNSFNTQMHEEVRDALSQIEQDQNVRVMVLSGAGRGFCAGQDLSDLDVTANDGSIDLGASIEKYYAPLVLRLRSLRMPVVCAVNGVAAGAGANLALACDIVIAKKSASFIQSFCKLGLVPDTGGTYALPRLVGTARAMGLALLGEKLSAEQAADWGMIWQCVDDADFDSVIDKIAQYLAAAPTQALARTKEAILSSGLRTLEQQLDHERWTMRDLGRTSDYKEGVAAFLEKRAPLFTGN
ncbi:MAG TPA: 2-(1,2-epoxy-1,2-dihydrophenyl)acetyl-CoA isomerase PaaG [Candidatus Sulfotelmatobacter sp.]